MIANLFPPNIARNAIHPSHLKIMAGKVLRRLERNDRATAERWSQQQARSTSEVCQAIDPELWEEAEDWYRRFVPVAKATISSLDVPLGGGGDARFLYFVTRWKKPVHAVETGVAAGWSTTAVLTAMARNGKGTLHSSDFPYFRLKNPEQYVGILVPNDIRDRWRLHLKGDQDNLPAIFREVSNVELFHYDSDKSRRGRQLAMGLATPHLSPDSVIVIDDIHNNLHFRDLTAETTRSWSVLEGHVGVIGV